ncbi:unnamed protein product [Schistosoma margrebowiei]|uniref:Uncharacterized protein n=1 Tax=Schistosoma margrebowiei TaxID=48269 RepID=A0A3P8EW00_9TREM|nr:unnamed protein product [Schistosoma margrebowiei]
MNSIHPFDRYSALIFFVQLNKSNLVYPEKPVFLLTR